MPIVPLRLKTVFLDDIIANLNWKQTSISAAISPKTAPALDGTSGKQDTIQYIGPELNPTFTRDKQIFRRRVSGLHRHLISAPGGEMDILAWSQEVHFGELMSDDDTASGTNDGIYLPSFIALLQGCGYDITTFTAETTGWGRPTQIILKVQQPIGGTAIDLRGYIDSDQYLHVQSSSGNMTLHLPTGQRAMADFEFTGKTNGIPDTTLAAPYTGDAITGEAAITAGDLVKSKFRPLVVTGITLADALKIGAGLDIEPQIGNIDVMLNAGIVRRPDPTQASGFAGARINDIDCEIVMTPEVNSPEKWDTFINNIGAVGGPFLLTISAITTGANTRSGWPGATTYTVNMKLVMQVQYDQAVLADRDDLQVWELHFKPQDAYTAPEVTLDFTYT